MSEKARNYARENQARYLSELKDLLSIPSISTQTKHKKDILRCAEWLSAKLTAIGLSRVEIFPTAKHPLVYGEWLEAGPTAPTVLVYGHYDVQPVDPLHEWVSPPFEPTQRGDDLFARGATDDKGQFYIHIAAVDALMQTDGKLPINIKFLLEGEEEIGSPHLEEFIISHQELLKADAVIISDTAMSSASQPLITTGVRGIAAFELTVRTAKRDLHSGSYGGVIHNPLLALAEIITQLNKNGTVQIPGFYDQVLPISQAEKARSSAEKNSYLAETGASKLWGEADIPPLLRTGGRPTLEVHGIVGGYTDEGQKTVIPAVATAKITTRLVPHQDPDTIAAQFQAYLDEIAPETVSVSLEYFGGSPAAIIDQEAAILKVASQAYTEVFGNAPIFRREGGSIPVVVTFQQVLNLPVAMMGFGLPDDALHAPNEKFHLPNFYQGIQTSLKTLYDYAQQYQAN
jgi:acetylornithine deacetylase/succinyl-diaminopimelate desuccinylase-like protein